MICVVFYQRRSEPCGFRVTGHAGYDEYGKDIVCAAVTSAVQLTANGITECIKQPADVQIEENTVFFQLPKSCSDPCAVSMLNALELHMKVLAQEYPENLKVTYLEV